MKSTIFRRANAIFDTWTNTLQAGGRGRPRCSALEVGHPLLRFHGDLGRGVCRIYERPWLEKECSCIESSLARKQWWFVFFSFRDRSCFRSVSLESWIGQRASVASMGLHIPLKRSHSCMVPTSFSSAKCAGCIKHDNAHNIILSSRYLLSGSYPYICSILQ